MEATGYHHIELRDGVPMIPKAGIKVVEIAEDFVKGGWDGQQIHENYPWISLPQIYSALAYYFEHKEAIDAEIERREQYDKEMRAKLENPELAARGREMKARLKQQA